MNHKLQTPKLFTEKAHSTVAEVEVNRRLFRNSSMPVRSAAMIDSNSYHFRAPIADEGYNNTDVIAGMLDYPDKFVELFEQKVIDTTLWNTYTSLGEWLNFGVGYLFTQVNSTFQNHECPQPLQGLNIPNPVSNL